MACFENSKALLVNLSRMASMIAMPQLYYGVEDGDCPSIVHNHYWFKVECARRVSLTPRLSGAPPLHPQNQAGSHRVRPSGSHRVRPSGSHRVRPSGSHRVRPSGSHRVRPSGSHRVRPSGLLRDPSPFENPNPCLMRHQRQVPDP